MLKLLNLTQDEHSNTGCKTDALSSAAEDIGVLRLREGRDDTIKTVTEVDERMKWDTEVTMGQAITVGIL